MSGGRKDDTDKLRFDLIPVAPLSEVARVYTIGAKKYGDRNWEKGIAWSRIYGALLRHAMSYWSGVRVDPTDGQHPLSSVVWCALTLMEYERTHPEMDDRPGHEQIEHGNAPDTEDSEGFKRKLLALFKSWKEKGEL